MTDPYTAPKVSISSKPVGRDNSTGFLTYDVTASSAAYWSQNGVCRLAGFSCLIGFQATLANTGTLENVEQAAIIYPTPSVHQRFTGSIDTSKISKVRAYISGNSGTLYSSWINVSDPYRAPTASVIVTSIQPGATPGTVTYDISSQSAAYWSSNGQCALPGFGCTIGVQAQYGPMNAITFVDSMGITYPTPSVVHEFTGTVAISGITAVRSYILGHAGELDGPWTPVSTNVLDGIDVAAAEAGILLAQPYSTDICFTLFQFGTHGSGSTVSDQELECNAALAGQEGLAGYLATLVAQYGPAVLVPLEVIAAGLISRATATANGVTTSPSGQSVLPQTCVRAGYPLISCTSGGTTHTFHDPNAPIAPDTVQSTNLAERFLANVPESKIPTMPSEGPLAGASPLKWATAMTSQCVDEINRVDPTPGKNGATFGAQAAATNDDCTNSAIFFTGINSPEASAHDLAAIIKKPDWLVLHYASRGEKAASGEPRKDTWRNTPPCDNNYDSDVEQCDEYPYYATDEGYPAAQTPSLLVIPKPDNLAQGGSYGAFVKTACPDIAASTRKTDGRRFLVIPIHELLLPTLYYCGTKGKTTQ